MILGRVLGGLRAALLSLMIPFGVGAAVIDEAGLLTPDIIQKLNSVESELLAKTGVQLDLITSSDTAIAAKIKGEVASYKNDKITLIMIPSPKGDSAGILDIYVSKSASGLIDTEAVLSPFSFSGSIKPLLSGKSPNYAAALFNGYNDIADRVANAKNVALESSIGDQNRTTLNIIRYFVYGSIALVIFVFAYRKIRKIYR